MATLRRFEIDAVVEKIILTLKEKQTDNFPKDPIKVRELVMKTYPGLKELETLTLEYVELEKRQGEIRDVIDTFIGEKSIKAKGRYNSVKVETLMESAAHTIKESQLIKINHEVIEREVILSTSSGGDLNATIDMLVKQFSK